ncbi:MAG: hypothetical protein WC661_11890 [Opitutaceae bacterium]
MSDIAKIQHPHPLIWVIISVVAALAAFGFVVGCIVIGFAFFVGS